MPIRSPNFDLRVSLTLLGFALACGTLSGCFAPWLSDDSPASRREQIKETLQSDKRPRLVNQIAYERMVTLSNLENIALVTGLPGTGGKVNASQPREKLLDTMRRRNADQPNTALDDASTAMVVARVTVPPAARKGEVLDVNVKLSSHAEASSLRQGWLMETSLVEMKRLGGQIREGFELATAQGQIVTAAEINGSQDPQDQTVGIVVGGARLRKSRELGIGVEGEFADAVTMAAILPAINARFTMFNGRKQAGIAVPVEDSYVELSLPSRYRLDPFHFMNVVLQLGFNEQESQLGQRLETLSKQVREPTTVRMACWQLEAIGERAVPILAEALEDPNREIRFYAAHSMAYLNDRRAVAPLSELCLQEPAFRAMCLNGLVVIDSYEAGDALADLLHAADAETRYGAVRALRQRDVANPQVAARNVGETGKILEIPSEGPPLVVISLHQTPEVVIFGNNPSLILPQFEYITPTMMINTAADGTLTISHFAAGREDRIARTTSDLRGILTAIAEVGGTYGNWVSFIREASEKGYLMEPIAMNPIPTAGRLFQRDNQEGDGLEPGELTYDEKNLEGGSESSSSRTAENRVWYNPFSWWQ